MPLPPPSSQIWKPPGSPPSPAIMNEPHCQRRMRASAGGPYPARDDRHTTCTAIAERRGGGYMSWQLPCHRDWESGGRSPNSFATVGHPHIISTLLVLSTSKQFREERGRTYQKFLVVHCTEFFFWRGHSAQQQSAPRASGGGGVGLHFIVIDPPFAPE